MPRLEITNCRDGCLVQLSLCGTFDGSRTFELAWGCTYKSFEGPGEVALVVEATLQGNIPKVAVPSPDQIGSRKDTTAA